MTQSPQKNKTSFSTVDHNTWQWKLFLAYDMLMMGLIVINLFILALQAIILSGFGGWVAQILYLTDYRNLYIKEWSVLVSRIDFYFICFLVIELSIRWLIAIIGQHHRRWWFFPFIHWYEVLAIIPQLRFLRLLRAAVIAYRLHELGYKVIPQNMFKQGKFYYNVIMEELTDRIILTAIRQIEKELETSAVYHQIIHDVIDTHRHQFSDVLAQTLQQSLATALAQQQTVISQHIGQIVNQSIENTPELTHLLRLMPIVGSRLEQQIQFIGQRLGENISSGIITPLAQTTASSQQVANPLLSEIAKQISQVSLNSEKIDDLVSSCVAQSLDAIKQQVKIKQWQITLDQSEERQNNKR